MAKQGREGKKSPRRRGGKNKSWSKTVGEGFLDHEIRNTGKQTKLERQAWAFKKSSVHYAEELGLNPETQFFKYCRQDNLGWSRQFYQLCIYFCNSFLFVSSDTGFPFIVSVFQNTFSK